MTKEVTGDKDFSKDKFDKKIQAKKPFFGPMKTWSLKY
jgi:hypothetical protein